MSTTSKNENRAGGPPEGGAAGGSVSDEAAAAKADPGKAETNVDVTRDGKGGPDIPVASSDGPLAAAAPVGAADSSSVNETVVDPPWATAAEPNTSVFADRAGAPAFGPAPAQPAAAQPGPTPNAVPAGQPPTDRPVASAAAALSAKLKAAAGSGGGADGKNPRRAHLQISRFEPWSVMKFSFIMSLVCFVVLFVAVTVLYMILAGLGVFDSITEAINETTRSPGGGTDAGSWFSAGRILGYTALIGALNVLLITALATVGSVIYNLASDFVGGVEVTLKEAE
ncbi:DUF3566 domain-containing protein [Actinocorallia sp. A-T 12471]|uniref:DUF3566 domain-containing protein n=1 Tax=Actinocorallia sp. A-T 12471 TaxID=3089813 RepID=UPI0029D29AEA|nr:DUF3566 domain-containing protein [Actinocorallia sp. A-T 12471]MDX6742113.1 DUF3566 domain-containing protein [Actinocorallia sp. A-T 12471]